MTYSGRLARKSRRQPGGKDRETLFITASTGLYGVRMRETLKAKGVYSDLLTLWKDADPGLPVLEQARAEYARLP